MKFCAVALLLVLPSAVLASVFVQYNSASDTALALRLAIGGSCRDVYATPRLYSDAQFLFREVPAIDGGAGVSLMPAANPGYYICSDRTGRLVAAGTTPTPADCSFNKVAGLSNPELVSFEQGGQYIGYAKAYDYDCASWFAGRAGWTVGLADKPSSPALATWIPADSGPLKVYVQDTNYWLGNHRGNAMFTEEIGDRYTNWDVVPALANSSSPTSISLHLHENSSLYLGVSSSGGEQKVHVLDVSSCSLSESNCSWTLIMSSVSGDFYLKVAGSDGWLQRATGMGNNTAALGSTSGSTLGFWRSNFSIPRAPEVVIIGPNTSSSSSGSSHRSACSGKLRCSTCVQTAQCGCSSEWFYDACMEEK
eukprot:m51a1_g10430 hypothetical protein (365) ;mRNA; f:41169-42434